MATATELNAAQRRQYAESIAMRLAQSGNAVDTDSAMQCARRIARMLKERYGATRVLLFGSLASNGYTQFSDIDLALEGVAAPRFYTCVAEAEALGGEYEVDIIDLAQCKPAFAQEILREGVLL